MPFSRVTDPTHYGLRSSVSGVRPFLVFLIITMVATSAMAQSRRATRETARPTTQDMSCAQAKGIVASRGSVVLHTGPSTYDLFMRHPSLCEPGLSGQPASVRTADVDRCPIGFTCRRIGK